MNTSCRNNEDSVIVFESPHSTTSFCFSRKELLDTPRRDRNINTYTGHEFNGFMKFQIQNFLNDQHYFN